MTASPSVDYDQDRLLALQVMVCARMDELLHALELSLPKTNKMYFGCCPIHGGNNRNALNLYFDGDSVPGYWRCNSRHCEKVFKQTIIGFVRGVLSHQKYGWTGPTSKKSASFGEAVDWCCRFLETPFRDIKVDHDELEKRRFAAGVNVIGRRANPQEGSGLSRIEFRKKLFSIPAPYFVNRGWSPQILNRYDVGAPRNPRHDMVNRVVVPIYDNDYRSVIGETGRSIFGRCPKCDLFHGDHDCPSPADAGLFCKWRNSNFSREGCLYNYWFSKNLIKKSGVAVIVEGPGDLWRLVEANINIGVGLLGTSLSDQQQILLEMSGALDLIIVTNSDAAGQLSSENLKQRLGRSFRLHFPKLNENDLGEMRPAQVRELLMPFLEKTR